MIQTNCLLRKASVLVGLGLMGLILNTAAAPATVAIPDDPLATLRRDHPRLLVGPGGFAALKQRVAKDPKLREWREALQHRADRMLAQAPSQYEIPDGLRLLSTSRRVLDRVYTLALVYRLEEDRRYRDRAWTELEAAAQFQDWNPRHFLDTAEMTHAFAIGYDWLHEVWSEDQRAQLQEALVEKGLKLGMASHESRVSYGWWVRAHHNWNQVCNGGIGMGALAVAENHPDLAGRFLKAALASIQLPMHEFAPDGAWNEGPGYWDYATDYNCTFLAALDTALGTDFGLSTMPGFGETGLFPLYVTGPTQRTFNYGDGGDGAVRAPHLFWLAQRFEQPALTTYQTRMASPQAMDLVWFPGAAHAAGPALPLDKHFRGVDIATFRSAWNEAEALFVGFKAGDNKANHSNLDLGSFVLDALGERWALDLGADNYNLPGYFGGQRWHYYRLRAEGHNTLVLNPGPDPGQDPRASARLFRFEADPDFPRAVADLTPAYQPAADRVWRGLSLPKRRHVLVQDEVDSGQPVDLWWFMHTRAQVELEADGRLARLRQGQAALQARLLSPEHATFQIMEAGPLPSSPHPDKQADNAGVRKLAVHLPPANRMRLTVVLTPYRPGQEVPPLGADLKPLADW